MKSIYSSILVVVQMACLLALALSGPVIVQPILLPLELASIGLGIYAVWSMRKSRLNVFPDLREGSRLISNGPYRLVRHPMYLTLILFALALLIDQYSHFRLIVTLVLLADLLFKIEYEEKLLSKALEDYDDYRQKSWKLIPFIY